MKKLDIIMFVLVIILVIAICVFSSLYKNDSNANYRNKIVSGDISNENDSSISDIDISINTDDGDEKVQWEDYSVNEYNLTDSLTINSSGIYNLTGTITNGQIRINAMNQNVKLILNNLNVTNMSGPAIFVEDAEDVIIELADGTKNYLEDGSTYSGYEEDEVGTIFSHSDITFQGTGSLEVKSNCGDAIVSKDDLKIVSGTYIVNSLDDAIRGKDSVYIQDGLFTINSSGDAIKSTNDTDVDKGFVKIENGSFLILSELDGISAETKLLIEGGTFNITTGGGSKVSSNNSSDWGMWGRKNKMPGMTNQATENTENTSSAKGIKAGDSIVIRNGTFILNTSDDAIHSNNNIGIEKGNFDIQTGDDGIHADGELIIDDGTINVSKSYEGIEGSKITLNGGDINVVSSDDGINVAGGNDSSSLNKKGANNFLKMPTQDSNNFLYINGGNISVDATGDGIDVNGNAYMYGGNVIVYGPENTGNGALDYDRIFEVNGGTLIAGGASGMALGVSDSSKQCSINITFDSSYGLNDVVKIIDKNTNSEIATYNSEKNYSSLVVSSKDIEIGNTYIITVNDEEYETVDIASNATFVGESRGQMGGRFRENLNGDPFGGKPMGGFSGDPIGRKPIEGFSGDPIGRKPREDFSGDLLKNRPSEIINI